MLFPLYYPPRLLTCLTAPFSGSSIGNVWANLGEHRFILFSPCFISSFPGPPYRQSHERRYKSGMCICTNDRCFDRTSFVNISIYIFIRLFFRILNKHLNVAGISGSAPIAVGGGSISNLFSERDGIVFSWTPLWYVNHGLLWMSFFLSSQVPSSVLSLEASSPR